MRELSTRYGRSNIGFLWLLGEPIIFASGVSILWSFIRPPYENGIKLIPFIITGYLPLILTRHMIGYTVGSIKNNASLLYHRMISPLHLMLARLLTEFIGVTLASVVVICFYNAIGIMGSPVDFEQLTYLYLGWLLLAWTSAGVAIIMTALAELFDAVERFIQVLTYVMVPLSGAFIMASSMPPKLRMIAMAIPFIHEFELIRRGYFGDSVVAIYDVPYALAWCAGLSLGGLALTEYIRDRVEMD